MSRIENYIEGAWSASSSERVLTVTDPGKGETLAEVPLSTAAEVGVAVRSA